jgi:tetratricopeptide (TPR) repeat protein/mono/diheme cytochrome c family protein
VIALSRPWSLFTLLTLPFGAQAAKAPNFTNDIAPIIFQNCTGCHRSGGAGPFPLTSYADVEKQARQIASVTARRYMPPWLPQPGYGEFQDERRLTDVQIQLIADWVRAGAPEGPPQDSSAAPATASNWQLGKPDLVLKAAHPFGLPAAGPDLFWNFVLDPKLPATRYVRAIEIQPGNARLVHHANLLVDRFGSLRKSAAGFAGMDFVLDRSPLDPESHFLFWKPGSIPYCEPDGMAWRLDPGNLLILNAHLQPSGKAEEVQPEIGLYFTDTPPARFPILIQLEHDGALDIAPGRRDFVISDDFQLPVDAEVLAIYPHAHYLGKLIEAYATLPDHRRIWLIRIPHWDLNRQAVYRYRTPISLPKGSVLSMRIHYDNSAANPRNPNHPPKRVQAGNDAADEMGHVWLQLLPLGRGDRRRTIEEALMRHRLEKYPDDFPAHLNLGALLLSKLDAQNAVTMLAAAVRIDPSRPEAHDMLGAALQNLGRLPDAIQEYRLALGADPQYWNARYNLAKALEKAGDLNGAVKNLKQVIAAFPGNTRLQSEYSALRARSDK